jgi:hypothetical protein
MPRVTALFTGKGGTEQATHSFEKPWRVVLPVNAVFLAASSPLQVSACAQAIGEELTLTETL